MMAAEEKPRFLTVKEYADLRRVHEETVYRHIAEGRIDGVSYEGRAIRIDRFLALSRRPRRDEDE
jgi:excisionase family DNA binding protein